MSQIGKKMTELLHSKIADYERSTRCGRVDLELADYRQVGDHDYELLVEYSRDRGAPAISQLDEWVTAELNGAMRMNLATVRDHSDLNAMRCHVRENFVPMPMQRSASMMKLGGGLYLDQNQNQWEVQTAPNGESVLVRSSDVNVQDILEERISRQRSGRYARVSLAQVKTAGVANLEVGDTVLYGDPAGGQLQQTGVLSKVGANDVSIKGREGKLPRSYVVDVVDKNSSAKKKQQQQMIDFLSEYLFAGNKGMATKAVK